MPDSNSDRGYWDNAVPRIFWMLMDDDEKKVAALKSLVSVCGYLYREARGEPRDEKLEVIAEDAIRDCLAYMLGRKRTAMRLTRFSRAVRLAHRPEIRIFRNSGNAETPTFPP